MARYLPLRLEKRDYIQISSIFSVSLGIFVTINIWFHHDIIPVFDANWYKFIAESGYIFNGDYQFQQNVAFLPLYPKLVSMLKWLPMGTGWIMLAVSAFVSWLSSVIYYDLIKRYFDSKIAIKTVSLFLLGPFSMYLFNGYSEALFILLSVFILHLLIVSRAYRSAAFVVALASIDRQYGIFLSFLVLLPYLVENRNHPEKLLNISSADNIYLIGFICGSGLLAFTFYEFLVFRDPFLFAHILGAWGFVDISFSFVQMLMGKGIIPGIVVFFKEGVSNPAGVGAVLFSAMIVMTFINRKKLPLLMSLYVLIMGCVMYFLSIGAAPGSYINAGRYALVLFPGWLALTVFIYSLFKGGVKESDGAYGEIAIRAVNIADILYWIILLTGVVLLITYTVRFVQGQWVS